MAFICGAYTATWNSLALGQTADGFRLSHQIFKRIITGDLYAETPQDAVMRGADLTLAMRLIEYNAAAIQTLKWPISATKWTVGSVGYLAVGSSLAKALVLTAVTGTPAVATPASVTVTKCLLHENFPVEVLFAPDLREVPLRLRAYPVEGVFAVET